MADGPAVGRAMEAGGGAALDVEHALAVKALAANAVFVKTDPTAAQGILGILTGDHLPGLGMGPGGIADLIEHPEVAGWGFAAVGIGFFAIAWVFNALKGRV